MPKPIMSVKDSLYVFEVCLEGNTEEADKMLARFMEAQTEE